MVAATKAFTDHKHLHPVSRSELSQVPTPQPTDTYSPVSFERVWSVFEEVMEEVAVPVCKDVGLERRDVRLIVSNDEKLFRGTQSFLKEGAGYGVRLVAESSHNKRAAVRFGIEGLVEVCSNGLCLPGFVKASARRHIPQQTPDIRSAAYTGIQGVPEFLQVMDQDRSSMVKTAMNDDAFFGFVGRLWGHNVLGGTQLNDCVAQWANPRYPAFAGRTLWSGYNAVTEVLKSVPFRGRESRYLNLHEVAMAEVDNRQAWRLGGDIGVSKVGQN